MIRAISTRQFAIDEDSLPIVVQHLIRNGFQESPEWRLISDGIEVKLTPNNTEILQYTLKFFISDDDVEVNKILLEAPKQLDEASACSLAADLCHLGFSERKYRRFSQKRKSTAYISHSPIDNHSTYHLITRLESRFIWDILEDAGLDMKSLDRAISIYERHLFNPRPSTPHAQIRIVLDDSEPLIWYFLPLQSSLPYGIFIVR